MPILEANPITSHRKLNYYHANLHGIQATARPHLGLCEEEKLPRDNTPIQPGELSQRLPQQESL
jgi:hypothetical protein